MSMKKWTLFLSLYFCLCLLSACGGAFSAASPAEQPSEPFAAAADPGAAAPSLAEDEEPAVLTCRIVDGAETGDLLLAELDGGMGVYRLDLLADTELEAAVPEKPRPTPIPVHLDGKPAALSDLEDGMTVDIFFNGAVEEIFPARPGEVYQVEGHSIGTEKNPGGSCYDLCGLYLQVLDDLWQKDPGLNENISMAGLDLSAAPGGLTDSEKAALAWRFGELHGVEVLTGTFEELEEQGYFTAGPLGEGAPEGAAFVRWEDGCLLSIKPNEGHEGEVYAGLPVLFFDAEKWRSSLGAYCFYDCSAVWPEKGTWSGYQIGSEMIS